MFIEVDTGKSPAWWGRTRGVTIQIGAFSVSIELQVAGSSLRQEISDLYALYPQENPDSLSDFTIALRSPNAWRSFFRPQMIQAYVNGRTRFQPMPQHLGVPMLESGMNWFIANTTRFLLLHAAVVEQDRKAVLMPGASGVGKSTLCAALVCHGWRLLSDELAMVRPEDGRLQPHPRPISLKNSSIDVIAKKMPDAHFSKRYEGTARGTIAYMRAPQEAIRKAEQTARPVLLVFPKYEPDARAELRPIEKAQAIMRLIDQSPNYFTMLGAGFETLANLVEACDHYTLSYHFLDDAISLIESLNPVPHGIEHVE